MTDTKKEKTKHDRYNARRTKDAQKNKCVIGGVKRRVNISISGDVWDALDNLDIESKSAIVEELIKKKLLEQGIKTE